MKCLECKDKTYFRIIDDEKVCYFACICRGPLNTQHDIHLMKPRLNIFEKLENVEATAINPVNRQIIYKEK